MPLQTSGEISLAQVQSEFGGSNPIEMAEYYRGGSFVPSTLAGAWSAYQGSLNTPVYYWSYDSSSGVAEIYWNGAYVATPPSSSTTHTAGGFEYQQGSIFDSLNTKSGSISFYQVRRRTPSESVNTSIPTSGTISMSNFYGGRKT
jgi:hypothetical protein